MDQSDAPLLEALANYRSGLHACMNLPDPADPSLQTIRVLA